MKKNTNETRTNKKLASKALEKSLMGIADIFAGLPCGGPWYEVKVPKKIQK